MSSYDQIAAGILHGNPPPHGYIVDIWEPEGEPDCMYLIVYADDINGKPDSYAGALATWLTATLNRLNTWTTANWSYKMWDTPNIQGHIGGVNG